MQPNKQFGKREWLVYSPKTKRLYCYHCILSSHYGKHDLLCVMVFLNCSRNLSLSWLNTSMNMLTEKQDRIEQRRPYWQLPRKSRVQFLSVSVDLTPYISCGSTGYISCYQVVQSDVFSPSLTSQARLASSKRITY